MSHGTDNAAATAASAGQRKVLSYRRTAIIFRVAWWLSAHCSYYVFVVDETRPIAMAKGRMQTRT